MRLTYHGPYRELIVPDDRIYFAGDHCSHIIGWQEGAALAAQRTITMIVNRVRHHVGADALVRPAERSSARLPEAANPRRAALAHPDEGVRAYVGVR